MKRSWIPGIVIFSICWLSSIACNKDVSSPLSLPDWGQILTSHTWQICCQTITPAICLRNDIYPKTDLLSNRPPCEKDDIIIFEKNGEWTLGEGTTSCEPVKSNVIAHGTWLLRGPADSLSLGLLNSEGDSYNYRVLYMDSALMVRRYQYTLSQVDYTITESLRSAD
jgi:hypothetical protein